MQRQDQIKLIESILNDHYKQAEMILAPHFHKVNKEYLSKAELPSNLSGLYIDPIVSDVDYFTQYQIFSLIDEFEITLCQDSNLDKYDELTLIEYLKQKVKNNIPLEEKSSIHNLLAMLLNYLKIANALKRDAFVEFDLPIKPISNINALFSRHENEGLLTPKTEENTCYSWCTLV